jgi:hypothetical protein
MTVEPGGSYENYYSITNNYDGDVVVDITLQNWNSYEGNAGLNVDDWLFVEPKKVSIKKGETKGLNYKIVTSTNMTGSISAHVVFTVVPPGNDMLRVKMLMPIYVIFKGTEDVNFEISDILFRKYEGQTLGKVTINNKGNVHIRPLGDYVIYKGKKRIYGGAIRESLPVYSHTTRDDLEFLIQKVGIKPGKYRIDILLRALGKTIQKSVKIKIDKNETIEKI